MAEKDIRPNHYPECKDCDVATGAILNAKGTSDNSVTINCIVYQPLSFIPFVKIKPTVTMHSLAPLDEDKIPPNQREFIEKVKEKLDPESYDPSKLVYQSNAFDVTNRCPRFNKDIKQNS